MLKLRGLRWWIIGLICLGTVVNYLARSSLSVAAPTLLEKLNMSTQQYSWVAATFQAGYTIAQPIAGYILDVIGLKLGFAIFAVIWALANVAHASVGSWVGLAFWRGVMGLSEAAAIPAGMKATALWFPATERGWAAGIFNIGTSLGAMIAPPLVVWAILWHSWQMAFIVTGAISLAWVVLWIFCYHSPEKHPALTEEERDYIFSGQEKSLASTGRRPSFKNILRQRNFWGIAIPRFLADPTWGTLNFWLPLYLVQARHMDLKQIALFAWLPFLAADVGALAAGFIATMAQKYGGFGLVNARRISFTIGAFLMVAPASVSLVSSPYVAIALLSIAGFAHQTLSTTVITMSSDLFPKDEVATVTGMAGTAAWLGTLVFSLVMGALVTKIGYDPFFIALMLFDWIAAIILWAVIRPKSDAPSGSTVSPAAH